MRKKLVAVIRCGGCAAQKETASGCAFGCLGCGGCTEVCPKKAISLPEGGPAVADREKCVGCGRCVKACPRQLIELVPAENTIQPVCRSLASAKETRAVCSAGCIGCGICEKVCPAGAIHVEENHAVIDQALCIACGMCAAKCPRGVIHDAQGIL